MYLKRARIVSQDKFEFSNYEFPVVYNQFFFSHATLIDRLKFYINRMFCLAVILITNRYANGYTNIQTNSEKKS